MLHSSGYLAAHNVTSVARDVVGRLQQDQSDDLGVGAPKRDRLVRAPTAAITFLARVARAEEAEGEGGKNHGRMRVGCAAGADAQLSWLGSPALLHAVFEKNMGAVKREEGV